MKAPEKIYLYPSDRAGEEYEAEWGDKPWGDDCVEYTRSDTLKLKEVDFERELSKYVSNGIHRFYPNVDDDYCKMESFIWQDYVIETAKYFFELGLKAKKENKL